MVLRHQSDPDYLGPYRILERVGTGAMGIVFRAHHESLDRPAAVKLRYRGQRADEALLSERFRQGARLQAELSHPAIVPVYDYVETDEYQAMVLEFLSGGSLEERLRADECPMPIAHTLACGALMCDAMAYAHTLGVIHRDIKPGNIMFGRANDITSMRISDFGVAKSIAKSPDLTVVGANVGTLWYMPPEQLSHGSLDGRADVYAIGATLYEMLTGTIPFDRVDTAEVFRRFLDGAPLPPIRSRNPSVPYAVACIIEASLVLDVESRIPSARALGSLLRAVIHMEGIAADRDAVESERDVALHQEISTAIRLLPAELQTGVSVSLGDAELANGPPTQSFNSSDFSVETTVHDAHTLPIMATTVDTVELRRPIVLSLDQVDDMLDDFDDDEEDKTIVTVADIDDIE